MSGIQRSVLFGDALRTLNIRPTARYRRIIITRAQLPFVGVVSITLIVMLIAGVDPDFLPLVIASWIGLVALTGLAMIVPWERRIEIGGLIIPALDVALMIVLAGGVEPQYPLIGTLILLPVLVLAYSFGILGLSASILGSIAVTALPLLLRGESPDSLTDWVNVFIVPVNIALLATGVSFASSIVQRIQHKLERTTRASEEAAEASENERAVIITVLETMDVGTAFVRPDRSTAFTNAAYRSIVALSDVDPELLAGRRVYGADRVTPVPPEHQMMAQALRGEYFESRLYWIGDGAAQRALLVTARPVIGVDGEKIGSAFVSKDVTELTDAIRAREDFLAGVSHELRTPLTSIIGYLEVIEDAIDAEAIGIARELGIIQRNSNQLMMRIGDLLNVTDETVELHVRTTDVPAVVKQAVDAIRFRAENAGIALAFDPGESFTASVDPGRFAQVLDNLLTNAVKYTPRGGSITVTLISDAAAFTIAVADSGTGISATELQHIFDRFYRSESVRGGGISGAGLGLSIVQKIVRAHGGAVDVRSELGVGTTFTVSIPR